MNEKYKLRKTEAITLISLVITIIVLIILAGVAIYLSLGNNGIFTRAKEAKELTNKQTATEIINLKITTAQMNKYAKEQRMPTLKELSEVLKKDDEILYVTETSQVASENKKYEVGENPSSIFTKLDKYPSYEFEINSSLQLASINGIKISTGNSNSSYRIGKIGEGNTSQPINFDTTKYDEIYIVINPSGNVKSATTISIKSLILTDEYTSYFGTAAASYGVNSYVQASKNGISSGFWAFNGTIDSAATMTVYGINY